MSAQPNSRVTDAMGRYQKVEKKPHGTGSQLIVTYTAPDGASEAFDRITQAALAQ